MTATVDQPFRSAPVRGDGAGPWRRRLAGLGGPLTPAVLAAAALVLYATASFLTYLTYRAPAYDLGFFDQIVENTAQGHPFETSFLGYSFAGQHWEPVLALIAPLDRLAATPLWLLGIEAVALATAPMFAWRLARVWVGGTWAPPAAAVACVLSPLLARAAAFGYHTEALTPLLALMALDGAARGHRWRFLLPALALGLVKEDALLVAAGVGWMVWCVERRRDGLVLAAGALVAFGTVVGVVMPAFRDGEAGDLTKLYSYLGGTTPVAMLRGALTHPRRVLDQLAGGSARRGIAVALLPLAALPLGAGWALLAVVPVLLVALLSQSPYQSELLLHYGLESFPLLLACSLLGWRRLRAVLQRRGGAAAGRTDPALAIALGAAALTGYLLASPLPGGIHADPFPTGLDRRAAVEAILVRIPAGAPVSASSGLVAHVSARPQVYEFPDRAFEEPWVIIDPSGPQPSWTRDAFTVDQLALPLHGYHVVATGGGVELWGR